jgi:hypothetical protein
MPPGFSLEPETDAMALQAQNDLGDSMGGTCTALNSLAAALGQGPIVSSDETNVPAVYFPGTGVLLRQDMPKDQRRSGQGVVAPIVVDVDWATYFFNRVTELLTSLERQTRASSGEQGTSKRQSS